MGNYLPSRLRNPQETSLQLEEYSKWKAEFLKDLLVMDNISNGEKEPEGFDYLDLPALVVRDRILSFVYSDPQNLLNVLVAIPSEAKICMLTREDLEFEIAFPDMLRTGALSWTMERELRQLSFISKHHRKVILKHFEDCLAKDILISDPWTMSATERGYVFLLNDTGFNHRNEGEMSIEKWRQFPTTRMVSVGWPNGWTITSRVLDALAKFGEVAWDVELYININDVRRGLQALKLMSNIRNLFLICREKSSKILELIANDLFGIELPELPCLSFLKLQVDHPLTDSRSIWTKVLKKYGPKLKQLAFRTSYSVPKFRVGVMPSFDALTMANLRFDHFNHEEISSQVAIRFLSILRNSPLKILKMNICERRETYRLSNFYSLLEHIDNAVGSSLEHLEMEFNLLLFMHKFVDYHNMPPLPNVRFPKLTHFETSLGALSPDAWVFLCVFPALETLRIGKYATWIENVELKGISKKLWKALPKLKWVQLSRQNVKVHREQVLGSPESGQKRDLSSIFLISFFIDLIYVCSFEKI